MKKFVSFIQLKERFRDGCSKRSGDLVEKTDKLLVCSIGKRETIRLEEKRKGLTAEYTFVERRGVSTSMDINNVNDIIVERNGDMSFKNNTDCLSLSINDHNVTCTDGIRKNN